MEFTKEELREKLRDVEEKEKQAEEEKKKEKNFQRFLNREEDWVIGKAHADIGRAQIDYRWEDYFGLNKKIGECISIHGNCGTSYNANAKITGATHIFFHNVWTNSQRSDFQKALNKVALKEIAKIMNNLRSKLEILGLQSDDFFLRTIYPTSRVAEIREMVWGETVKLLDKHKDIEFKKLFGANGDGGYKTELSHSNGILLRYLKEKRKKLYDVYCK